jgi:hypothetical protein
MGGVVLFYFAHFFNMKRNFDSRNSRPLKKLEGALTFSVVSNTV